MANVETDWAADLMARKDAVRFDLNVDPRRPNDAARFAGTVSGMAGSLSFLISMNSHSSSSVTSRGWSKAHSEYRGCRLSVGLRWLEGLGGERRLGGDARLWSNDGIESLDVDLTESGDSCSESVQGRCFSLSLSGGLRRMSRGE